MKHAFFFFGIPTIAIIGGHFLFMKLFMDGNLAYLNLTTTPILFLGLILLGIGYFYRKERKHIILFLGWLIFAIYWATQPEFLYYKGEKDTVNAIFCIVGVYFLSYISYHEYLCYKRDEEIESLNFLAGASFFAGMLYFVVQKIYFLAGFLVKIVAQQTVWILNIFGYSFSVGVINVDPHTLEVSVQIIGATPSIILACTGLQSMAVFIGVFIALNADKRKRIKAFFITVPTIYILNLIRNVGVVYGVEQLGIDFGIMHNVIGKIGSLIALIILAFIVFDLLPELYDNIMDLFDLPKRNGPIERMFKMMKKR